MATNRDLLKEAIADAKAVKEMAIANAKATLEESFTPQLKSMLSAKLQEMEEEEELDEVGFGKGSSHGEEGFSSMGEKSLDEEELEEDLDLNELFGELNEEEEAEEESEESKEEESEDENLPDLTDMSPEEQDEYLKDIIEKVLSDMMESGEVKLSGDEMGAEEESEEEINLDELLAEIESLEEDDMGESEEYEELEEASVVGDATTVQAIFGILSAIGAVGILWKLIKIMSEGPKWKQDAIRTVRQALKEKKIDIRTAGALLTQIEKIQDEATLSAALTKAKLSPASSSDTAPSPETVKELEEAYSTIETLRGELNEVNLLNAKLLYTNKIFKAKTLTESQKLNVLGMFDKATTVKETKLVFETLSEGLKTKSTPIKENLGSASKIMGTTTPKQPIVESNDMVARFQKLAGIIK